MTCEVWPRRAAQLLWTAWLVLLCAATAQASIQYQVSLKQRQEHRFIVWMTVPDVTGELVVQMPAWNALYQIRDFAHRVQNVRAYQLHDAGSAVPVAVRKRDKLTWVVAGRGTLRLEYAVFWDEASPFSSQLNTEHAFLNLATLLFYVPTRRHEDVRIAFTDLRDGWRIATALPAEDAFTFRAASYDLLVDAPVEISAFSEFRFEVNGARIRVVVHGSYARDRLEADLRRIVAYQTQLMREVPFEEFLFLYHFGEGGGGMEHANSTAIFAGSHDSSAHVSAHEFFHLWNVKRIRPQGLEPVDYSRENYTRALWFAEGVTSTYADYTLVRSGLWSPRQFYNSLAQELDELESRPAHHWKSAEEASLDAWHEGYRLYRRPDLSISYYNKGYLLGVLLDILIRDLSDNRASLDDVLRYLNETYARKGRFYEESEGIQQAVEVVVLRAGSASAVARPRIVEFFARYVAGTDPLPADEWLERAGLRRERNGGRSTIVEMVPATERQRRIREGLLRGATDPP
ncbi:MAG: hypothetical protein K6U02_08650 [Firmicutes bacterium]|nr:hypothetical protein [Bacillota bacterium]